MAGRGMGIATKGGGAVESGPRNKMISETSKTTGPVMMAKGGAAMKKPKGMMAGGMMSGDPMRDQMMRDQMMAGGMKKGGEAKKKPKGMMAGGMMSKGYAAGGAAMKKKGFAGGGKKS